MSKDYFVLRSSRVVYLPGHYDLEGARATARRVLGQHPKATVTIVKIEEVLTHPDRKEVKP